MEKEKRPGLASLLLGLLFAAAQYILFYLLKFGLGWRISVFLLAFMVLGVFMGIISLGEPKERVIGIAGLIINILGIIHYIMLLFNLF